jgi:hypothetical protein
MAQDGWAELSKGSTIEGSPPVIVIVYHLVVCSEHTHIGVSLDKPFKMQSQMFYSDPCVVSLVSGHGVRGTCYVLTDTPMN